MKIEVSGQSSVSYPYLGVSEATGEVVLFSAYGIGTRLRGPSVFNNNIAYATSWRMDYFKPFEGELKVSN